MHHYFEAITNTSGDSLVGYFGRVINRTNNNTVTLASDDNGTPIVVVSGIENMAKTDNFGNLDFYVEPGTYDLEIYAPNATSLIMRVPNVAMDSGKGEKGDEGEPGPPGAADNTYTTFASLIASDPARKSARLVPEAGETEPAGNFNYIGGTWVRQQDDGLTFQQAGAGAVPRTTRDKARERVSVLDFYRATDPDTTNAFLSARDECEKTGKTLWVPTSPVPYLNSETVRVSGSFDIRGEGAEKTLITMNSAVAKPVFEVTPPNNQVILGMWLAGMQLRCSGGAAACDGVVVRSAPTNSTIRQCQFDNLWIRDCRRGLSLEGVVYRNFFSNITVQGTSDIGVYCDAGFVDVTYNTFEQMEVTNVGNGAWAYYIHSNNSIFDTLTSDGVAYFSSPGGVLRGYKLETIQADTFPEGAGKDANGMCLILNQMQLVDAASCIGVLPSKRRYFMRVIGTNTSIRGTRFTPPQPINPYFFEDGSGGTVDGTYMEGIRTPVETATKRFVEDAHTDEILNRWLFSACDDITKRSARRQQGTWTPNFSAEWTTPPSGVAGTWRRSGDKVLYIATGTGGVCTAGAAIGGLPQMDGAPMHNTRGNGQLVSPTQASPCLITAPSETTLRSFRALNIPAADEWTLVVEAGA